MLNNNELSSLKSIAEKYKIAELDNFILEQEDKKTKARVDKGEIIKEKRKKDRFYARPNKNVENYSVAQYEKIIKNLVNENDELARAIFKETTTTLNIHGGKFLHSFLNMFTREQILWLEGDDN